MFTSIVRHPAAPLLLLCLTSLATPPGVARAQSAERATLAPAVCLERLDAAVRLAEGGDTGLARLRLERLAARCERLPQIQHDLGVIAAREERLPAAFRHFEAALDADPRAAMTLAHLRALHRREAALGYARALGRAGDLPRPRLEFQDSDDVGTAVPPAPERTDGSRRDIATLERALRAWWRSAVDADVDDRLAHYVEGYPEEDALAGRWRDATLDWGDVRRELAFTTEEAVAMLAPPGVAPRLLLLRLDGNRWRIYRESSLPPAPAADGPADGPTGGAVGE